VALVVGIALGVFPILADGRPLTLLGNIAAPSARAAFAIGYRATSQKQGAIACALALVVGVAT
jgi:hypothetical protein